MRSSAHLFKGCSCGLTKKRDPNFVACKDSSRKSRCSCLRQSMYCSNLCKCFSCGNRIEEQKSSDLDTTFDCSSKSRRRCHPDPFKRTKGATFLAERGFDITPGPWTSLETVTLFVVIEVLTTCSSIQLNSKMVCELYNFVVSSSTVKDMALPIACKAFSRVVAKLAFINSKHAVFESLMESLGT